MVSAKVPKELSEAINMLGDQKELGKPLFTKLVPYSVHLAASIYADRRDRLVNNNIIDELEAMTGHIKEILLSLNLPGSLQALEKPLGLPPGLIAHAEEIRGQDGINRLRRSIEETKKLKENDRAIYNEGVEILRAEEAEDNRARRKYGTDQWNRPPSAEAVPKLFAQIAEIDGYLKSAANSDSLVKNKLKENEFHITLLGATDRDIEQFVPSSRRVTLSPTMEKEVSKLRSCLNELNRLESKRARKVEALRVKAKQDDVNSDLLKEAARLERTYPMQPIEATHFEPLFDTRLKMYDGDLASLKDEEREQSALIKKLQDANNSFVAAKKADTASGIVKEREKVLQQLENAYYKYKEIINNLEVGRKFYNDLARIVVRFRDDAKTFAYQRRNDASQLEADITTGVAGLSLNTQPLQPSRPPPPSQVLPQQSSDEAASVSTGSGAAAEEPLMAPTPTRKSMPPPPAVGGTWNPDIGIRFGNSPAPTGGGMGGPHDAEGTPATNTRSKGKGRGR
jgi:programmed cell death 6-interacting protein